MAGSSKLDQNDEIFVEGSSVVAFAMRMCFVFRKLGDGLRLLGLRTLKK